MKAKKTILIGKMPGLYAVGCAALGGQQWYIAASEIRQGPVALINCETDEVQYIHGGEGGVMGIMGSSRENHLLSIEEFYQGFDAPHSKIIDISLSRKDGVWEVVRRKPLAEVPYLHRLGVLREPDGVYLAAGKLCRKKDFTDDWSSGGALEIYSFDGEDVTGCESIQEGLFKHHAMLLEPDEGGDILYYGGIEGTFRAVRRDGAWRVDRLTDAPTSEIVYADLDGDGRRELAIVEDFHGDRMVILKEGGNGLERALEYPLTLGHVLWGGLLCGKMSLISGSRQGAGELTIRRFAPDGKGGICLTEEFTVDSGIGPSQIQVRDLRDRAEILTSCYLPGQLVKYTITET